MQKFSTLAITCVVAFLVAACGGTANNGTSNTYSNYNGGTNTYTSNNTNSMSTSSNTGYGSNSMSNS